MNTAAAHFAAALGEDDEHDPRGDGDGEGACVDPAAPRRLQVDLRTDGGRLEKRQLGHLDALIGNGSGTF
jgi:hypothetical protein